MEKEITSIKKSIGGLKGSLVHTNQKVNNLEKSLAETIEQTTNALTSVKDSFEGVEERLGMLAARIELLSHKIKEPWYKRIFKK